MRSGFQTSPAFLKVIDNLRIFASLRMTVLMHAEQPELMKVRAQFYAQLRDLIGVDEMEVELPKGETVRELLEKIYAHRPALRAHDRSILVGAGLEFVDRNYKLKPGEEIAIMPPVQGG